MEFFDDLIQRVQDAVVEAVEPAALLMERIDSSLQEMQAANAELAVSNLGLAASNWAL